MSAFVFGPTHAELIRGGESVSDCCSVRSVELSEIERIVSVSWAGHDVRLLMDKFLLVLPRSAPEKRHAVQAAFFSWLAPQYEQVIDLGRNRENVHTLLDLLQLRAPGTVLDFGCGTGVTFEEVRRRGHRVIGVDACATMRGLAIQKGMEVYPPDFDGKPLLLDGIISSYVFHYAPDRDSLLPSWSRLLPGGLLAANVHKGVGLNDCLATLGALGGVLRALVVKPGKERHGVYVVVQR